MSIDLKENKYREKKPMETIIQIRELLLKLKILPIENKWYICNQIYIVDLVIPYSGIHVYGNGTNYYIALADGYMELMKGLQNLLFFNKNNGFISNSHKFSWAPDEVTINIDEKHMENSIFRVFNLHNEYTNDKTDSELICLPFADMQFGGICHIPSNSLSIHGMCSGNSKDEALVEGICNIMKEYVRVKMEEKQITPPNVPRTYLNKYGFIKKLIYNIRKDTDAQIILKDCSLGEGFPVLGAVLLNRNKHECFFSLGCHPIFEVAAEEALVSLISSYTLEREGTNLINNQIQTNCLINLFSKESNYLFKPFPLEEASTTGRLFNYLTNLLKLKKFRLMIRDVSFLGFNSYNVVIPEMEISQQKQDTTLSKFLLLKQWIDEKNYKGLTDYLLKHPQFLLTSINEVYDIIIDNLTWYNENIGMNFVLELIQSNDLGNAAIILEKIISTQYCETTLYQCLLEIIHLKEKNFEDYEILNLLNNLYTVKTIKDITQLFNKAKDYLINCYHCKSCVYKNYCSYAKKRSIYYKLMNIYGKTTIDQLSLTYG